MWKVPPVLGLRDMGKYPLPVHEFSSLKTRPVKILPDSPDSCPIELPMFDSPKCLKKLEVEIILLIHLKIGIIKGGLLM